MMFFHGVTKIRFWFCVPSSTAHAARVVVFCDKQGTVWKVVWAHPDFGQLLATCSQDRTVKIWVSGEGVNYYGGT